MKLFYIFFSLLLYNIFRNDRKFLVIVNLHWNIFSGIDFWRKIYIPYFKKYFKYKTEFVFYSPSEVKNLSIKSNHLKPNGYYSQHTISIAYEENKKNYIGYIFMNDDSFVNPILFNKYNLKYPLVETTGISGMKSKWQWIKMKNKNGIRNIDAINDFLKEICVENKYRKNKICKYKDKYITYHGWSDFMYIPRKFIKEFVYLENKSFKYKVFLEMMMNTIIQAFPYNLIKNKCFYRNDNKMLNTCVHVHPVKYSKVHIRKNVYEFLKQF